MSGFVDQNTWQVKAQSNGNISSIKSNQGIIGDTYFFLISTNKNLISGFTTGPSGTIESTLKSTMNNFIPPSMGETDITPLKTDNSFNYEKNRERLTRLQFKIDTSLLEEIPEEAPKLLKDISNSPFLDGGAQLSLDFKIDQEVKSKSVTPEILKDIIDYLSDFDGCITLKVTALDDTGKPKVFDISDTNLTKISTINTNRYYISEASAFDVLKEIDEI